MISFRNWMNVVDCKTRKNVNEMGMTYRLCSFITVFSNSESLNFSVFEQKLWFIYTLTSLYQMRGGQSINITNAGFE